MSEKIAIIGAGISGAVLAKALTSRGHHVTVFEKARGAGGRMSTRKAEGISFDHGAQYFTLRNVAARQWMQPLFDKGLIQHWHGPYVTVYHDATTQPFKRIDNCFVGVPGMSSIPKALLEGIEVQYNTTVTPIKADGKSWRLTDGDGKNLGSFDRVLFTAPPQQSVALLPDSFAHRATLKALDLFACHALLVAPQLSIKPRWAAGRVDGNSYFSWLAWNHTKPGRTDTPALVAHTRRAWSADRLERDLTDAEIDELLTEAERLTGARLRPHHYLATHCWRYARPIDPRGPGALWDAKHKLGYASDACTGGRVEGAIVSALDLVSQMEL